MHYQPRSYDIWPSSTAGRCEHTDVGYRRVSTFEQILDLQRDALNAAKSDRIFTDTMSGSRSDRPGLEQALDYLREGDILVVLGCDR